MTSSVSALKACRALIYVEMKTKYEIKMEKAVLRAMSEIRDS